MKKLIAVIGICMLGYILPAAAETANGTTQGTETGNTGVAKRHFDPEKIAAKIDERIKKLEAHKAKAASAGKTDIVNAIQALEDALNNLKSAVNAKDKNAVKTAHEKVKAAREALKNALPEKIKEKIKEHRATKKSANAGNSSQN